MEVNTTIAGGYGEVYGAGQRKNTLGASSGTAADGEGTAADIFRKLKQAFEEDNKLTAENIKAETDWRDMTDAEWDKLLEHLDGYLADYKEQMEYLKEVQEEAAVRASAGAPADMRALLVAQAMLKVAASAGATGNVDSNAEQLEKESWTYNLETDDQEILATAKAANEYARDVMSKSQELAILGDTETGISETEETTELASMETTEGKKIWTITAFSENGIVCTRCEDGVSTVLWRLDYKNSGDNEKVLDFLRSFDKDAELKFASSKDFWERFLAGEISAEEIEKLREDVYN